MNIDTSIGNGSFSEAKITIAGNVYYGLEDLLRRFDEEEFSNYYGIVDKKTNKNISPKEFLLVWIQKELQKEWDDTVAMLNTSDGELMDMIKKHYK